MDNFARLEYEISKGLTTCPAENRLLRGRCESRIKFYETYLYVAIALTVVSSFRKRAAKGGGYFLAMWQRGRRRSREVD